MKLLVFIMTLAFSFQSSAAHRAITWQTTAIDLTQDEPLPYNSWPWGNAFYDELRDQVVVAYTSGSVHLESDPEDYDKIARCIIKTNASSESVTGTNNAFGSPITVYSEEGVSCPIHAITQRSNGDYVAIVSRLIYPDGNNANTTNVVCISTNGGLSWASSVMGGITSAWVTNLAELDGGRLIACSTQDATTPIQSASNLKRYVIYSDDDGATWTQGETFNTSLCQPGSGYQAWEPLFVPLTCGCVASLWRGNVFNGPDVSVLWSLNKSGDGISWSPLKRTSIITSSNPVAYTRTGDSIVLAAGSRSSTQNGIYIVQTTDRMMARGEFGPQLWIRCGRSDSDFGYPALAASDSKVWLYYYDVSGGGTGVFEVRGETAAEEPVTLTITFLSGTTPTNIALHADYAGPGTPSAALYDSGDGVWHSYTSKNIPVNGDYVAFKGDWRTSGGIYRAMFKSALAGAYTCKLSGALEYTPSTFAYCYYATFRDCSALVQMDDNPLPNLTGSPAKSMFQYTFRGSSLTSLPAGCLDTSGLTGSPAASMFQATFFGSSLTSIPAGCLDTSGLTGPPAATMCFYTFYGNNLTNFPAGCCDTSGLTGPPASYMFGYTFYGNNLSTNDFVIGSGITLTDANISSGNHVTYMFGANATWTGQLYWGTNVIHHVLTPSTDINTFIGCTSMPEYGTIDANWK